MQTSDRSRYEVLMDVVRNRTTVRAFDRSFQVPREHYELILEAARHTAAWPRRPASSSWRATSAG